MTYLSKIANASALFLPLVSYYSDPSSKDFRKHEYMPHLRACPTNILQTEVWGTGSNLTHMVIFFSLITCEKLIYIEKFG